LRKDLRECRAVFENRILQNKTYLLSIIGIDVSVIETTLTILEKRKII